MPDSPHHGWQRASRRDVLKAGTAAAGMAGIGALQTELTYAQDNGESVTVTIRRDEYGVPHIYARDGDSRAPVFYGYGYATAKDRLYQLELYRRYYHGTVAEVLGEGDENNWIQFDQAARRNTAGEPSLDEQAEEQLTGDQREVLQAFTDGINRYIQEVRDSDEMEFHKGFADHGFEPDDFTTEDAAGMFVGSMAYFSGFQLETLGASVVGALTAQTGSEERAMELFADLNWGDDPGAPTSTVQSDDGYTPPYTDVQTGETTSPEASGTATGGGSAAASQPTNRITGGDYAIPSDAAAVHEREMDRMRTLASGLDALGLPIKYGSNALAVQGDITESGDALLFGGPQMGFNTPSIMYEAGLHGPDFDVAGSTVAGYPFIMFGHNRNGALTSTAGIDNCLQMFTESITVNEDGPDTYTFQGEEHEIETTEKTITVADGEDVTYTERFTRHGVVTQWDPENGQALAQTKSYAGRHMNCWRAYYEAQFAEDAEEFRDAAQQCDYALNFLWADKSGDIAYVHLGRYPDAETVEWDTRLPADGTQYELTDDDYLSASDGEVPSAINPDPGYSAQWNNKPAPGWNNGDLSYSWSTDHRVQRIINLVEHRLDENGAVNFEDMKDIIYDVSFTDLRSIRYKNHLLDALDGADLTETEQQARAELDSWGHFAQADGEDNEGEYPAGYTIWNATFPTILQEVFAGTFGDAYGPASYFLNYDYGRGTLMRVLNPEETALELQADYAGGTPEEALVSAFKSAVGDLAEQYDGDPSSWQSEAALHEFNNLALFGMPIGVTSAGNTALMNRGTENHIVRLSDDPRAENILPPGNDGYVAPDGSTGDHYNDQLELFENFEYKQLLFSDDDVEAATESTTELTMGDGSDDPNDGTTPDPTPTAEPTPDSTPTPSETTTTGESGPGFTALTGAAAVIGSALVWLRKRNDD
ncbi:penicillin acylase family protein [Salinibaculum salinum]|uniref:penicillin acylase family protein n=1 Tax=Salinibaculum salinum TaxID=3131996 RepID=UPI0030ED949D